MFDIHKTRMIGLPCCKETMTMTMLSHFHRIRERNGRMDRIALSIWYRPSA